MTNVEVPARTIAASPAPAPGRRPVQEISGSWLLLPIVAALLVFFIYPLARIIWLSFAAPELGIGNYLALLTDGVTVTVLIRTLVSAAVVAAFTLLLAYPYAYAMTRVSTRTRALLTILVLMPFWTSVVARTFAWYLLEQPGGLIEQGFSAVGIEGLVLRGTSAGATVAMVQVMLPFMVLPLYSSMAAIDQRLLPAAVSLGAPRWSAFRTVYMPLSLPGIASGVTLVFIIALGFYVTPALLGSPSDALLSQIIARRVSKLLDFPGAGALGTILLVVTLLILFLVRKVGKPFAITDEAVRHGS